MTEDGAAGSSTDPDTATTGSVPRRSVVAHLVDLGSSQLITWVLAIVLTIIQPRFLGPEGQGQLRFA